MAKTNTPATSDAPAEAAKKVVKIGRATIALNVFTQLVIFFLLVVMANHLSFRHFKRWDFSRDRKFELAGQTKSLLATLQKPVKAVVFFYSAAEIYPDVQGLLKEYEYASGKKFNTEVVDPFANLTRAQELQAKYKFGANENIVILDYDGKNKFVNASDMAEFEMPDQMQMMMGQTQPKFKAFKGEQAITSALMELVEAKPSKIYFVSGHGEPDMAGPELKSFVEGLKRQNIQHAALNLLNASNVPEDARALVICGPKYDYSELEMKFIADYWERKGRLFVMLNSFAQTPRLTDWIGSNGVVPQNDRVIRTGTFLGPDENGVMAIKSGMVGEAVFTFVESQTKLTKELAGISKKLPGATQSLRLDRTKEQTAKVRLTSLIESGEGFWGETDPPSTGQTPFFDPKKDHMGPLTIAAAIEKGAVADPRVKVETSRAVVVGNGELLSDTTARQTEGVTLFFGMNTLNWLLDREDMIGIPPKAKKEITITLDEPQMNRLKTLVLLFIPGLVAVCGLANWWFRRN